jgi:co-chaperonin GroES (HSP10)
MKIQPLKGFIVVKDVTQQNASGLYLPDSQTEKHVVGEVVESAVDGIDKGDKVVYSVYGRNELRDGVEKVYLVPEKELFAKVWFKVEKNVDAELI